jgi:hypothetical protein
MVTIRLTRIIRFWVGINPENKRILRHFRDKQGSEIASAIHFGMACFQLGTKKI